MDPWPGLLLCGVVVVVVIVWLARAQKGGAERKLKQAAGADAAERLIRYELTKTPGLSRSDAARRAYDRRAWASMAAQGRDVKLSIDRVEGNRAFLNKIWNAARFALMRLL